MRQGPVAGKGSITLKAPVLHGSSGLQHGFPRVKHSGGVRTLLSLISRFKEERTPQPRPQLAHTQQTAALAPAQGGHMQGWPEPPQPPEEPTAPATESHGAIPLPGSGEGHVLMHRTVATCASTGVVATSRPRPLIRSRCAGQTDTASTSHPPPWHCLSPSHGPSCRPCACLYRRGKQGEPSPAPGKSDPGPPGALLHLIMLAAAFLSWVRSSGSWITSSRKPITLNFSSSLVSKSCRSRHSVNAL